MSIGVSSAGSASPSPPPGAATKKSSRWSSPPAVWTCMKPPAPGPVRGGSAPQDMRTAATAASTALPPARRTSAPARAVTGWPAAITPRMRGTYLARNELRHVDLVERAAGAGAPDARLGVGRDAGVVRRGADPRAVAVTGRHHGHPDLIADLLIDHRAEDDVGVRVRGLRDRLGGLVDLPQGQVRPAG